MLGSTIPGTESLGQPRLGSIFDKTGTPASGYATGGPYHCGDCIHKTKSDEPFCIHPRVVGDHDLQDKLVLIDGRPVVKIDMMHGCCEYVRQTRHEGDEDKNHGSECKG